MLALHGDEIQSHRFWPMRNKKTWRRLKSTPSPCHGCHLLPKHSNSPECLPRLSQASISLKAQCSKQRENTLRNPLMCAGVFPHLRPSQVQSSARTECQLGLLLYSPISVDTGPPPDTAGAFQADCASQQYPSCAPSSCPGPPQQRAALAVNRLAALPGTARPAQHRCSKMPGFWPKSLAAP